MKRIVRGDSKGLMIIFLGYRFRPGLPPKRHNEDRNISKLRINKEYFQQVEAANNGKIPRSQTETQFNSIGEKVEIRASSQYWDWLWVFKPNQFKSGRCEIWFHDRAEVD